MYVRMVPQDCFELRLLNFAPKSLKGVMNWALQSFGGIGISIERTDIGTVLYRSNTVP